jgi:predicted DNA-binding transcriptional regulator AlpA
MPLLTQTDVAALLGLSPRTIEDWRVRGIGPRFIRLSARAVRYDPYAVASWVASRQEVASTTAAAL